MSACRRSTPAILPDGASVAPVLPEGGTFGCLILELTGNRSLPAVVIPPSTRTRESFGREMEHADTSLVSPHEHTTRHSTHSSLFSDGPFVLAVARQHAFARRSRSPRTTSTYGLKTGSPASPAPSKQTPSSGLSSPCSARSRETTTSMASEARTSHGSCVWVLRSHSGRTTCPYTSVCMVYRQCCGRRCPKTVGFSRPLRLSDPPSGEGSCAT